jgi:hypothetical protein
LKPEVSLSQVVHGAHFFSGRGTLKAIASTPFTQDAWKIFAFKHEGVIFLMDAKNPLQSDVVANDFVGHRFEQLITYKPPETRPNTTNPLNTFNRFMVMCKSTLMRKKDEAPLVCMYSAETDCIDKAGNFIELKTELENLSPARHRANKYLSWYLQCRLAGIREVVVGIKKTPAIYGKTPCTVKEVKRIPIKSLPMKADGRSHWNERECIDFLYAYLAKIKAILDEKPEGMMATGQLLEKEEVTITVEAAEKSSYNCLRKELLRRLATPQC